MTPFRGQTVRIELEAVGQERLLSNLKAAGLEHRAAIQTGDMRKLPFEAAAFDGVVSAYAIDHLNRDGVTASLSEASRVLKKAASSCSS